MPIETNPSIDYARCKPDILERFWSKVDRSGSCWEWSSRRSRHGYGQFTPYSGRQMFAHRFIDIAMNGEIEEGLVVTHICDNPSCVRPSHLRRATQKQNIDDMDAKGRRNVATYSGSYHYKAKLTDDQVAEIRSLDNRGESKKWIAEKYGISLGHVYNVLRRKSWKALVTET